MKTAPRGRGALLTLLVSTLLTAATARDEAPTVDVMDTLPDDAPPPTVHRDPDPRWADAAKDLEASCRNETDSAEYVACLARRVDGSVNELDDIPGVMCTLSSLVDDNHVPVSTHPKRQSSGTV